MQEWAQSRKGPQALTLPYAGGGPIKSLPSHSTVSLEGSGQKPSCRAERQSPAQDLTAKEILLIGADLGAPHPRGSTTIPRTGRPEISGWEWGQKLSQEHLHPWAWALPAPKTFVLGRKPYPLQANETRKVPSPPCRSRPEPRNWIWQGEPGCTVGPSSPLVRAPRTGHNLSHHSHASGLATGSHPRAGKVSWLLVVAPCSSDSKMPFHAPLGSTEVCLTPPNHTSATAVPPRHLMYSVGCALGFVFVWKKGLYDFKKKFFFSNSRSGPATSWSLETMGEERLRGGAVVLSGDINSYWLLAPMATDVPLLSLTSPGTALYSYLEFFWTLIGESLCKSKLPGFIKPFTCQSRQTVYIF